MSESGEAAKQPEKKLGGMLSFMRRAQEDIVADAEREAADAKAAEAKAAAEAAEAKVEAEEESERRSMEWDESMRTLDSLRNSCRSDPEQLQKTESRIGSLLNAAI